MSSSITFAVELNSKPNSKGLYKIRVRMTQERKHKRINLGYAIEKKHFNSKKPYIRNSHKLHAILNAAISTKITELEAEYLKSIPLQKPVTIEQIYQDAKKTIIGPNFIDYCYEYVNAIKNGNTKASFLSPVKKLEKFKPNLHFSEIDEQLIKNFEVYLRQTYKNNSTTVKFSFSVLRLVYNKAVKEKHYIPTTISPLSELNLKKEKFYRHKLTVEEVTLIENLELPITSKLYHARNFFLLGYYLLGVRGGSLIEMRWENIIDNRCVYKASKGKKAMNIIIHQKAMSIIDEYRKNKTGSFIFPFINESKDLLLDNDRFLKRIKCIVKIINRKLQQIAKMVGIEKNVTSHVMRHSFAYNARLMSQNDIYAVQKALGHSSVTTTERYFATDETVEADSLSDIMFGK